MTCKDCVHEKVCKNAYLFKVTPPNVCGYFKNKADYVEVKHGEWIEEYRGLCPREKVIVCNLCGRTTEIKEPYC